MHPVAGGNFGHDFLPGCGSLTAPLDSVQSVTGLLSKSLAEEEAQAGGPTPFGFLPRARSGNLGEMGHVLLSCRKLGRKEEGTCLAFCSWHFCCHPSS